MGESADVGEIEFFSDSGEEAKLSDFGPWQTNSFRSGIYTELSFNLKKRSCFWCELYITVMGNYQSLRT